MVGKRQSFNHLCCCEAVVTSAVLLLSRKAVKNQEMACKAGTLQMGRYTPKNLAGASPNNFLPYIASLLPRKEKLGCRTSPQPRVNRCKAASTAAKKQAWNGRSQLLCTQYNHDVLRTPTSGRPVLLPTFLVTTNFALYLLPVLSCSDFQSRPVGALYLRKAGMVVCTTPP